MYRVEDCSAGQAATPPWAQRLPVKAYCSMIVTVAAIAAAPSGARGDGACCLPDGTCAEGTSIACLISQGNYQGEGTTCATTQCGACCLPEGPCEGDSASNCTGAGGEFQGTGVSCDPNPCPPGACCYQGFDLECLEVNGELCLNDVQGTFLGGRSISKKKIPGDCCLAAQNGDVLCSDADFACCDAIQLINRFVTPSFCHPLDCPPAGACCFGNGTCVFGFEPKCVANGGEFAGEGILCGPDDTCLPCPNGICEPVENCASCPNDCGCGPGEICDAGVCTICGNDICDAAEDCASCPADCPCPPGFECVSGNCEPLCGNDSCEVEENCSSCPADCPCGPPTVCVDGECTTCGNGTCDAQESCADCAEDCPCPIGQVCGPRGCTCNEACPGDLDGSGSVNAADLAVLLGHWGACD